MNFDLGKKYESKSKNTLRSILISILLTFFILCIIIVSFMICVMIILILKKLWFICLIIAALCVFTISNVLSRSLERHRISNLKMFKIALIIQYVGVIIPSTIILIFTIFANYKEHILPTEYNLNVKSNIVKVLSDTKDGFAVGSLTIPTILVILPLLFFALLLLVQIITLNYEDTIYIEGDDMVVYPEYVFSLIDENLENDDVSFKYLRDLNFAEDEYIVSDMRYYDFYIYGDSEQYFYIETYLTVEDKNKVKKQNIVKSDIYVYDVSLFEEKNEFDDITF
ncbi:MAG: hypothetical protein ACK5K7_04690 [Bacilli bacterium]